MFCFAARRTFFFLSTLSVVLLGVLPASARPHHAAHARVAHVGAHHAAATAGHHGAHASHASRAERHSTARVSATHLVRGRHGRLLRVASRTARRGRALLRELVCRSTRALGDLSAGEDPIVRAAAIEALGNMNGTAMAIDPATGRVLALVNQKLALQLRRRALLDHQAHGRARRPAGRPRQARHPCRARGQFPRQPHRGARALQQSLLRNARPRARL